MSTNHLFSSILLTFPSFFLPLKATNTYQNHANSAGPICAGPISAALRPVFFLSGMLEIIIPLIVQWYHPAKGMNFHHNNISNYNLINNSNKANTNSDLFMFKAFGTDSSLSELKNSFEGLQTSILKELSRMETAMSFLRRRQYEFPKDSNRIFSRFRNYEK